MRHTETKLAKMG